MIPALFDGTVEHLARGLAYATRRHDLLAQNLANVETPGYKARDLAFEDHLRPLLQIVSPEAPLPLEPVGRTERRPRVVLAQDGPTKPDGNDVNLDRQMARLTENVLFHNALTQVLASHFAALKQAISGRV